MPVVVVAAACAWIASCEGPALEGQHSSLLTNLALGRPATQSSTAWDAPAERAVDGETDGEFFHGSVTHTGDDAEAWWEVDLGEAAAIEDIELWPRTDCCSERLADFLVFVSAEPFGSTDPADLTSTGVWSFHGAEAVTSTLSIPVGITGRYVRVQLLGFDYLSLAEVRVMGQAAGAPPVLDGFAAGSVGTVIQDLTTTVTVRGSGFAPGARLLLTGPTPEAPPQGIAADAVDATSLTFTSNFASDTFQPGAYALQVQNPDGQRSDVVTLTLWDVLGDTMGEVVFGELALEDAVRAVEDAGFAITGGEAGDLEVALDIADPITRQTVASLSVAGEVVHLEPWLLARFEIPQCLYDGTPFMISKATGFRNGMDRAKNPFGIAVHISPVIIEANFLMAAAIAQAFLDWNRMLSSVPGGAPVFQVPDPRMIRGDIAPDTVVVRCYTQDELRGLDEQAAKVRNTRRAVADAYSWGRHGNNLVPHDWAVYQNNTGRIRMDCRSEARSQVFTYSTVLHEIGHLLGLGHDFPRDEDVVRSVPLARPLMAPSPGYTESAFRKMGEGALKALIDRYQVGETVGNIAGYVFGQAIHRLLHVPPTPRQLLALNRALSPTVEPILGVQACRETEQTRVVEDLECPTDPDGRAALEEAIEWFLAETEGVFTPDEQEELLAPLRACLSWTCIYGRPVMVGGVQAASGMPEPVSYDDESHSDSTLDDEISFRSAITYGGTPRGMGGLWSHWMHFEDGLLYQGGGYEPKQFLFFEGLNGDDMDPEVPSDYFRFDSLMYFSFASAAHLATSTEEHASALLAFVSSDTQRQDAAGNPISFSGGTPGPGVFISGDPSGSSTRYEHLDPDAPITAGAANGYWLAVDAETGEVQLRSAYDNSILTTYGTFDDFGIPYEDESVQLSLEIRARIEAAETVIDTWIGGAPQPTVTDASEHRVAAPGGVPKLVNSQVGTSTRIIFGDFCFAGDERP